MSDARARQLAREEDADSAAVADRLLAIHDLACVNVAATPRGAAFITRAMSSVADSLRAECDQKSLGRAKSGLNALRKIDPEIAAAIAIRECINKCCDLAEGSWGVTIQELAISIGELYDTEIMIADAAAVNPMYMQKVAQRIELAGTSSLHHIRAVYSAAYTAVMKGVIDSRLSRQEMLLLGRFGLQACMDAGIVTHTAVTTSSGCANTYHLTDDVQEFLTGMNADDLLRHTDRSIGSMVCPPDPWTNMYDGGYISVRRKAAHKLVTIKSRTRNKIRDWMRVNLTAEKVPKEFEAINYLQAQPYRVHETVVRNIRRVWEGGGGVLGVPTKNAPKRPVCPMPESWSTSEANEEEMAKFNEWKSRARRHYEDLRKWRSKTREISGLLKSLERDDGTIWFPVFTDTRSRKYYRGCPSPQGSDIAKSSLHFANLKPLGREGVFWLKVHIANCLGMDKVEFAERAKYVEQHWGRLVLAMNDPMNHADVLGSDSPWCAWAAIHELYRAVQSGEPESYCTGIPVHMDATCSGLQHFSALLRDPVGGKYVNLLTTSKDKVKSDIYGYVAGISTQHMQLDGGQFAEFWTANGIPRSLAKKPVMTYVYSAVMSSTAEWIEDEVHRTTGWPEWIDPGAASRYAAKYLFTGIEATVPAACALMRWMKAATAECAKRGPMLWFTPTGFPVWHDYRECDDHRVRVQSCGAMRCTIREYSDTIDKIRSKNAVSPNFVHSLDGSHVTGTVLRMKALGLSMVAIHDSFGTHPCDVGAMHSEIRTAFVDMYKDNSILGNFIWSLGVPCEQPMRGTMQIEAVHESWAFFS